MGSRAAAGRAEPWLGPGIHEPERRVQTTEWGKEDALHPKAPLAHGLHQAEPSGAKHPPLLAGAWVGVCADG